MKKIFLFIIGIIFSFSLFASEQRSIYAGDIIELSFSASDEITIQNIQESFSEFEILSLKLNEKTYILNIRTFDIGEKKVTIGNKNITFNINSVLDEKEYNNKKDIIKVDELKMDVGNISSPFPLTEIIYIFILVVLSIVLGFIIYLTKKIKFNKFVKKVPIDIFINNFEKINTDDKDFFVKLTFLFKDYIYNTYGKLIIGKTSKEIIKELKEINIKTDENFLENLEKWFSFSDMCKFTNYEPSLNDKESKKLEIKEIVFLIEKISKGVNM